MLRRNPTRLGSYLESSIIGLGLVATHRKTLAAKSMSSDLEKMQAESGESAKKPLSAA
jgi:hypothetical protein